MQRGSANADVGYKYLALLCKILNSAARGSAACNLTAHHRCTIVGFLSFALSGGVNAGSSSHSSLTSQAALYFIPETRGYKCTGSPINRSSQPPKRPVDWATTGVPEAYTEATLRAVDLK